VIKDLKMVYGIDDLIMAETYQRATTGQILMDHLATTRDFPGFDKLVFVPRQVSRFVLQEEETVNLRTTIGKKAARPMNIGTPIMISGMTWGLVSTQGKLALAKGSAMCDTAANSGEGGFDPREREYARHYVVQYNRAGFSNSDEDLRQADMVEIRYGQGADAGVPESVDPHYIGENLRRRQGLSESQPANYPARFPHINDRKVLKQAVGYLRSLGTGVPISIKFAAACVEADIDAALEVGADVIVIDGAQGGTGYSPHLVQDSFGIPTIYGLVRAIKHLDHIGARKDVDLVVSGGFRRPDDVLKAIALGADAVYIGTVALLSMCITQNQDRMHLDDPFRLVWYFHPDTAGQLDVDTAAHSFANFIHSLNQEMMLACRLLGKRDIHQVTSDDLVAVDEHTALVTGVSPAWQPPADYSYRFSENNDRPGDVVAEHQYSMM